MGGVLLREVWSGWWCCSLFSDHARPQVNVERLQLEDLILAFVSLELAPIEPTDAQARELREYYTAMTAALVEGCLTAQLEVRSAGKWRPSRPSCPLTPRALVLVPRAPRRSFSLATCLSGTQSVAWPICFSERSRARSWPTSLAARSHHRSPTVG